MNRNENLIKERAKYLRRKDIEEYAKEHNISFVYAETILNILKADTKRKQCIIYIHSRLGCSWSDAIYRYNKYVRK